MSQVIASAVDKHMALVAQVTAAVPELCVLFHESVQALSKAFLAKERRHVYVTPTSYLELIHSYKTLLTKKQNEVRTHYARVLWPSIARTCWRRLQCFAVNAVDRICLSHLPLWQLSTKYPYVVFAAQFLPVRNTAENVVWRQLLYCQCCDCR